MKQLFILRGIPGCGKTTVAESISPFVCEADKYFMKDGVYDWKPEEIGTAHMWCQSLCEFYMKAGHEKVVVSNTSTRERDLSPYYEMAEKYGYVVFSLVVENRHGGTDTHSVPDEVKERMEEQLKASLKLR